MSTILDEGFFSRFLGGSGAAASSALRFRVFFELPTENSNEASGSAVVVRAGAARFGAGCMVRGADTFGAVTLRSGAATSGAAPLGYVDVVAGCFTCCAVTVVTSLGTAADKGVATVDEVSFGLGLNGGMIIGTAN